MATDRAAAQDSELACVANARDSRNAGDERPAQPAASSDAALSLEQVAEMNTLLSRAADALHDAAWVMRDNPHEPPMPPAVDYVLPQTERVRDEIRRFLHG